MNDQVHEGVGLRFDVGIVLQLIILLLDHLLDLLIGSGPLATLAAVLFGATAASLAVLLAVEVSKVLHIRHLDRLLALLLIFLLDIEECFAV